MYIGNETGSIASGPEYRDEFLELHGSGRMTVDEGAPWTGRLDWQRSSRYGIALCGSVQEEFTRGRRDIRSTPRGTFELLMPISGAARVEQGTSSGEIGPGTLALCEIDRPVGLAHGLDFTSIAVIVPAEEIERRNPAAVRRPPALDGLSGVGRLIRQMITALHAERRQLTEAGFDFAADQLLDLVLFAADGATDAAPLDQRARVEAEIRRHIRRHAEEPDLNIVAIARALGWSPRYLQDVLNAAGTTARDLIRTERLLLAHSRLTSTGWAGRSIAQIAHASGFTNQASFATAYRQQFGRTPRETRRSAAQT